MYKTILDPNSAEIIIQKSRFIAYAAPIENEDEAKAYIEKIRKQHAQATHCVPAYLLGNPYRIERYSDDGEPSGTAGVPVLSMLKNEGLTDLCIVVVRYFGGIKLGTGGLVRAYTASAKAVLEGKVVEVNNYCHFTCSYDYHYHGKINYHLNEVGAHVADIAYADKITAQFYIEAEREAAFNASLVELTSNNIEIEKHIVSGALVDGGFVALDN